MQEAIAPEFRGKGGKIPVVIQPFILPIAPETAISIRNVHLLKTVSIRVRTAYQKNSNFGKKNCPLSLSPQNLFAKVNPWSVLNGFFFAHCGLKGALY